MQERLDEARDWWQNGLALCTGDSEYDRLGYLIFEMAIGEGSAQLATLKTLLIDNPPTTKNLESILEDLDLLAECPELPAAATARTLIQSHLTL
ncbi:MAG: hypothetical protein EA001_04940 [Oscillatoriales cyanobacterium]|nr:MAG: hypothetical protein EA001_04940 [Oscillatoriales cyanobacterium]